MMMFHSYFFLQFRASIVSKQKEEDEDKLIIETRRIGFVREYAYLGDPNKINRVHRLTD